MLGNRHGIHGHRSRRSCQWRPKGKGSGYVLEFEHAVMTGDKHRIDMCFTKDTGSSLQFAETTIRV